MGLLLAILTGFFASTMCFEFADTLRGHGWLPQKQRQQKTVLFFGGAALMILLTISNLRVFLE